MRSLAALLVLSLAFGSAACAQVSGQVTWDSAAGPVVYASEDGQAGVFEYPVPFGDNVGYLYIDGLAGEFGGHGPLTGYWSEPDVSHDDDNDTTLICPFAIIDGAGRTTRNWGQLTMVFADEDFPSDFVMLRGRCFEPPHDVLTGKLRR